MIYSNKKCVIPHIPPFGAVSLIQSTHVNTHEMLSKSLICFVPLLTTNAKKLFSYHFTDVTVLSSCEWNYYYDSKSIEF
jgi:hypothetical protein